MLIRWLMGEPVGWNVGAFCQLNFVTRPQYNHMHKDNILKQWKTHKSNFKLHWHFQQSIFVWKLHLQCGHFGSYGTSFQADILLADWINDSSDHSFLYPSLLNLFAAMTASQVVTRLAGVSGALAVAAGAYGAHGREGLFCGYVVHDCMSRIERGVLLFGCTCGVPYWQRA